MKTQDKLQGMEDRKFPDQCTTRKRQSSYAIHVKQRINYSFATGKSHYCTKVEVQMFVSPNNWLGYLQVRNLSLVGMKMQEKLQGMEDSKHNHGIWPR